MGQVVLMCKSKLAACQEESECMLGAMVGREDGDKAAFAWWVVTACYPRAGEGGSDSSNQSHLL